MKEYTSHGRGGHGRGQDPENHGGFPGVGIEDSVLLPGAQDAEDEGKIDMRNTDTEIPANSYTAALAAKVLYKKYQYLICFLSEESSHPIKHVKMFICSLTNVILRVYA